MKHVLPKFYNPVTPLLEPFLKTSFRSLLMNSESFNGEFDPLVTSISVDYLFSSACPSESG